MRTRTNYEIKTVRIFKFEIRDRLGVRIFVFVDENKPTVVNP